MAPENIRFTNIRTMYDFINDNPEKFSQMWVYSSSYPNKQDLLNDIGLTEEDLKDVDRWLWFCQNYYKPKFYGTILPDQKGHSIILNDDNIAIIAFKLIDDFLVKHKLVITENDLSLYSFTYL